jgi:rhodanese-related sulfurtransferase
VLDIRNPREWATKHIDGSVNIPLNHLQERIREIPRDGPLLSFHMGVNANLARLT